MTQTILHNKDMNLNVEHHQIHLGLIKFPQKHNNYTPEGNNRYVYLDRQHVACPTGALKEFYLIREAVDNQHTGNFRYSYKCDGSQVHDKTKHKTQQIDEMDGKTKHLSQLDVACPTGKVLTEFALKRDH